VSRELERAIRLHKSFRERAPTRARHVKIDLPEVAVIMGYLDAVSYTTTHNGKTHRYKHTFKRGSKPTLVAGTRDGQLLIVGGRFRVTGRGIVDLTHHRREIED